MNTQKKTGYKTAFLNWYALCKPNKKYFTLQISTTLLTAILYVIEPICSAQVLTYLVAGLYSDAIKWLIITVSFLSFRQLVWHYNYWNWSRLIGDSYKRINMRLYNKVVAAENKNFKVTSKEKILNTIGTDVYTVCNFADLFSTRISRLFRVIITIVVVCVNSWIAAIIIIAVSLFNFLMYNMLDNKLAIINREVRETKDGMFEIMTDIADGREAVDDLGLKKTMNDNYMASCDEYMKRQHKASMLGSYKANIVYMIWNIIVCLATIYLVYLVEGNTLTYTVYLVITSYLTSSIEKVTDFFGVFAELRSAEIATARVNTILTFKEKDLIEYGNNLTDKIQGTISFTNVSLKETDVENENVGEINDVSFFINKGESVLIQGQTKCGKRQIFRLLKRAVKPDSGVITVDGIDIFDYGENVEKTNITYTGSKPYFFEGSIMQNMKYVEPNEKKIKKMFKTCEIDEFVANLPNGYDTNINKHAELVPQYEKFVMGFARALLTNSEIIMVYEFPSQLNNDQKEKAKLLLNKFKRKKTIIIFSALDDAGKYCDKVIKLFRGRVQ